MTREKSFKRLVRARMAKTGESYTAARAMLLRAAEEPTKSEHPVLATSDAEIRRRTGRGWEEWFDLLDEWHADELAHREMARRVADELGIEPLVWEAQAVTVSYERARGLRAVGQRADGFAVTASKTVAVPVERLFEAVADASQRAGWLPDGQLSPRTVSRPTSLRFDWEDGSTRVNVVLDAKSEAKSTVTLEHARLADPGEADRMKTYWRDRLAALKAQLEGEIALAHLIVALASNEGVAANVLHRLGVTPDNLSRAAGLTGGPRSQAASAPPPESNRTRSGAHSAAPPCSPSSEATTMSARSTSCSSSRPIPGHR